LNYELFTKLGVSQPLVLGEDQSHSGDRQPSDDRAADPASGTHPRRV
jgi:hypothetical protein